MRTLIAIPLLLAVVAGILPAADALEQEVTAMGRLRSAVLPGETSFQSGGYVDTDHDGVAEFAFLSEMSGAHRHPQLTYDLFTPPFPEPGVALNGYLFAVYLPDGRGGAIDRPENRPADPALAKPRERRWIAYAWPATAQDGHRMFAIDDAKRLYAAPSSGAAPTWNTLFGGKGWDDERTWAPVGFIDHAR